MASSFQLSLHDVLPHTSPLWARRRQSEGPRSLTPDLAPWAAPSHALAPSLAPALDPALVVAEANATAEAEAEAEAEEAEAGAGRAEPGKWRVVVGRAPFARVEAQDEAEVEVVEAEAEAEAEAEVEAAPRLGRDHTRDHTQADAPPIASARILTPTPALLRARWYRALAHAAERGREHAAERKSVAQQQVSSSDRLVCVAGCSSGGGEGESCRGEAGECDPSPYSTRPGCVGGITTLLTTRYSLLATHYTHYPLNTTHTHYPHYYLHHHSAGSPANGRTSGAPPARSVPQAHGGASRSGRCGQIARLMTGASPRALSRFPALRCAASPSWDPQPLQPHQPPPALPCGVVHTQLRHRREGDRREIASRERALARSRASPISRPSSAPDLPSSHRSGPRWRRPQHRGGGRCRCHT